MGLIQERPQVTFLNVSIGKLRNVKKGIVVPGYEGIITGIRLIKGKDTEGRDKEDLQIRMADPTDEVNPNVIISGTFEAGGKTTVWARMAIARLLKATREGIIGQGTSIQLGVYTPKKDSKATCVSLRVPDDASPIRGIDLPTDDLLLTRGIIRDGIVELAAIYGDLSKNPPSTQPSHDDSEYDDHDEDYEEEYEKHSGDRQIGNNETVQVSSPSETAISQTTGNEPSIELLFAEFERCAKKAYGEAWEASADDLVIELLHNEVLFAANMTHDQLIQVLTKLRADIGMPTLGDAEMIWKTAQQRKWTRQAFNALLAHYELKSEYEIPKVAFTQFMGDVRNVEYMQEFLKLTASS